jgi:hypothetical protein
VNELFLAAMVDDRRRSLIANAERSHMVRRAKQTSRPRVGEKHRTARWRVLLPHIRFGVVRPAVGEV